MDPVYQEIDDFLSKSASTIRFIQSHGINKVFLFLFLDRLSVVFYPWIPRNPGL